jgi:hypothetical protein
VPLPPEEKGGGGERLGESQFRRLEKKLSTQPTLCGKLSAFIEINLRNKLKTATKEKKVFSTPACLQGILRDAKNTEIYNTVKPEALRVFTLLCSSVKRFLKKIKFLDTFHRKHFYQFHPPIPTMLQLPHVGKKGQEEGKADIRFMAVLIGRLKVGVNTAVKAVYLPFLLVFPPFVPQVEVEFGEAWPISTKATKFVFLY